MGELDIHGGAGGIQADLDDVTAFAIAVDHAADEVARNLETPIAEMGLPVRVETRTGDTPSHKRARQIERPPDILLTTPEQLALLLAHREAAELFRGLRRVVLDLRDGEVRGVTTLTLLDIHRLRKCLPHAILPLEVVLLHALVVIALAALADTDSAHLGEIGVDVARNKVVMLVGLVAETEDNVLEIGKLVFTIRELEAIVGKVLTESDGVVGGLAFTVGGHDEENARVLGDLVEVLEVVLLGITDERGETELLLRLLGKTNGILLRSTCLRAVEDDDALFL